VIAANSPPPRIGRPGAPVRAFAFSGGGFDTAFQLGTVHALLVSRGQAPDVIIGTSAGAVNAVAAAEILQAGDGAKTPEDRLWKRVVRFREIYQAYLNGPGEIAQYLMPDTSQTGNQSPLKPLELPIHAKGEVAARGVFLQSRAGLLTLYNEVLEVRLGIGTLVRALRQWLGLQASGEIRKPRARHVVWIAEVLRTWLLAGSNLHRLAPLAVPIVGASMQSAMARSEGATAADLIFRPVVWHRVGKAVQRTFTLLGMVTLWTMVSAVPFLAMLRVALVVRELRPHAPFVSWRVLGSLALFPTLAVAVLAGLVLASWARLPKGPTALRALLSAVQAAILLTVWLGVVVVVALALAGALLLLTGKAGQAVVDSQVSARAVGIAAAVLGTLITVGKISYEKRRVRTELNWIPPAVALGLAVVTLLAVKLDSAFPHSSLITAVDQTGLLPPSLAMMIAILLGASAIPAITALVVLYRGRRTIIRDLLRRYSLADGVFDPYPVRQFFIRLFDPDYYGGVGLEGAVDRAIRDSDTPDESPRTDKTLGSYGQSPVTPIDITLAVAEVATGSLTQLSGDVQVVDALLAATAVTPLFPPYPLDGKLYLDASNVANEPSRSLLTYLRDRVNPAASALHLYSVRSLPFSLRSLPLPGGASGSFGNLLDVVMRAMELQRFRDARLDTKLTRLYTRAMPVQGGITFDAEGKRYLRTKLHALEPEAPLRVNEQLLSAASPDERRKVIAQTIADGCRASLERMAGPAILETSMPDPPRPSSAEVACRHAMARHLRHQAQRRGEAPQEDPDPGIPGSTQWTPAGPPGDDIPPGPGLTEVCRECSLYRQSEHPLPRSLRVLEERELFPEWPQEPWTMGGKPEDVPFLGESFNTPTSPRRETMTRELSDWERSESWRERWPRDHGFDSGSGRPTVSLLFSGGVFRGVYQVGVLNALDQVSLRPDILAGASVGSITAAMVGRVMRERDTTRRRLLIARLAATYLAIDRLVLTDRFANFVRLLTVRAAGTLFSIRQADRVFRRYDEALPGEFGAEARAVIAGLERLFHISPLEVSQLFDAIRRRETRRVQRLLRNHLQDWLERSGVGEQVLGAEPLAMLITDHVLAPYRDPSTRPGAVPFDAFLSSGIYFLATATNLTRGRLEVLGERQKSSRTGPVRHQAMLLDGLLASSAFPGVFRPRWSWEVTPGTPDTHQYIDGGVMDNLPLDAVAQFLDYASMARLVSRRPSVMAVTPGGTELRPVPHLLFAASLEVDTPILPAAQVEALRQDWPQLLSRAKQLGYNKKIEVYANAQRAVRRITRARGSQPPGGTEPLDLEVVAVTPNWLCGTFAFHPMLRFRRMRQIESIAHGCASTLLELSKLQANPESAHWAKAWGINLSALPDHRLAARADPFEPLPLGPKQVRWTEALQERVQRTLVELRTRVAQIRKKAPDPEPKQDEESPTTPKPPPNPCWFRPEHSCPFGPEVLAKTSLAGPTAAELARIYQKCGDARTHHPR
jgi:predicted acylesterase/phospholipase RssA